MDRISDLKAAFPNMCESWGRTVVFSMTVDGNTLTFDQCKEWFERMTTFKVHYMAGNTATKLYNRLYKEKKFYSGLKNDFKLGHFLYTLQPKYEDNSHPIEYIYILYDIIKSDLIAFMNIDYFDEHKDKILKDFNEMFISFNGCMGYICNYFDNVILQNPKDAKVYTELGIDLSTVKIIPGQMTGLWYDQIDVQCLPGHKDILSGFLPFQVCYGMWFGPDYYRFIQEENVASFTDCEKNVDLGNGFRYIFFIR